MEFHRFVRRVFGRLAAALLIALLAGPQIAPGSPPVAGERAASSAHDDGMAATPPNAASVNLAVAPAAAPAPPASAIQRTLVSFQPHLWRVVTDRTCQPPFAVKPAPTVLRL